MLKKGDQIEDFSLLDQEGKTRRLSDFLGRGYVVVFFYPRDETPGCVKEATCFRDAFEDFNDCDAEIIGISGDSVDSHRQFANNRDLPFTLLSDPDFKVHAMFGCEPGPLTLLKKRVTFVLDAAGIVRHIYSSRLLFTKHVQEALASIRQLKMVDEVNRL